MGPANDSPSPYPTLRHLLPLLLLLTILSEAEPEPERGHGLTADFTREDFPPDFVFGAGTSAYQYEGAVAEDGRTPSVWDTFTHQGGSPDKGTGDVAADGYHKYKEDVQLMIDTGLDAYRFSISWSRLIPDGRGEVNPKGLEYYNNVIDELVKHGIQPHVTLYHFDLPQSLEDEYGGWLSPKIVDDFEAYADVCFREFGDRVLHWTTINEPNVFAIGSYDLGMLPPNRCSSPFGISNCTAGNSTTEPYIALHHELLAHITTANLYKTKYQAIQNGLIGANVYSIGFTPFTNSTADIKAVERVMDFMIGWVLDPLVNGDYPQVMKEIAGSKLPTFTKQQSVLLRGSFDFLGLNHYTSVIIKDASPPVSGSRDFIADMAVQFTISRNDTPTGRFAPTDLPFAPDGLEMVLNSIRRKYGNPAIYIHENGIGTQKGLLNDTKRIQYLKGYIGAMLKASRNGSNTKGYIMWSFLDVFEFLFGYQSPLGLYNVDFSDKNLRRVPKSSAIWYRDLIKKKGSSEDIEIVGFNTTTLQDTK